MKLLFGVFFLSLSLALPAAGDSTTDLEWFHENCEVAFNEPGTILVVEGKVELILDVEAGLVTDGSGETVLWSRSEAEGWSSLNDVVEKKLAELGLPTMGELRANPNLCYKGA